MTHSERFEENAALIVHAARSLLEDADVRAACEEKVSELQSMASGRTVPLRVTHDELVLVKRSLREAADKLAYQAVAGLPRFATQCRNDAAELELLIRKLNHVH